MEPTHQISTNLACSYCVQCSLVDAVEGEPCGGTAPTYDELKSQVAALEQAMARLQDVQDALGDVLTGTPSKDEHTLVKLATSLVAERDALEQERDVARDSIRAWIERHAKDVQAERDVLEVEINETRDVNEYLKQQNVEVHNHWETMKAERDAQQARVDKMMESLKLIQSCLVEINPNNYDAEDVDSQNTSVIAAWHIAEQALSPPPARTEREP